MALDLYCVRATLLDMATKKTEKPAPPVRTPKPKSVAAMANPLIETSFRMEPHELKLLVFVCSLIHEEDDFFTYGFTVEEAAQAMGRKFDRDHQSFYDDLKGWSKDILSRVVVLPGFTAYEGDVPKTLYTHFFDSFAYIEGSGRVEVTLKDWIRPYLLNLKSEFTRIAVRDFARLQSFYGLKLFMLLHQYRKIGRRKFTLPELRFALGVEKHEYPNWYEFYRRVIQGAITDLRRADLLEVETVLHKRGRAVHEVEFRFYKPGAEVRDVTPTPEEQAILDRRMKHFARWQKLRKGLQAELGLDPDEEQENLDRQADEALAKELGK